MLTPEQSKAVIDTIGKQYSPEIIAQLNKRKIFNHKGESYKPADIQKIVRMERENDLIEMEIAKLIVRLKKKQKRDQEKKDNLFKNL